MRRHTITEGAKTTAGGVVIMGSGYNAINGASIALESDLVYCKACRSCGHILCVGPRIQETWGGRQIALEDDLCICGCTPPPRLIPSQRANYQTIHGDGTITQTEASNAFPIADPCT